MQISYAGTIKGKTLPYLQTNKGVRQFSVQNLQCSRINDTIFHSESDILIGAIPTCFSLIIQE